MIRQQLHINPLELGRDEWIKRYNEAAWLKEEDLKNLAMLLAELAKAVLGDNNPQR